MRKDQKLYNLTARAIFPLLSPVLCDKCKVYVKREKMWQIWTPRLLERYGKKYLSERPSVHYYCQSCCPTRNDAIRLVIEIKEVWDHIKAFTEKYFSCPFN